MSKLPDGFHKKVIMEANRVARKSKRGLILGPPEMATTHLDRFIQQSSGVKALSIEVEDRGRFIVRTRGEDEGKVLFFQGRAIGGVSKDLAKSGWKFEICLTKFPHSKFSIFCKRI